MRFFHAVAAATGRELSLETQPKYTLSAPLFLLAPSLQTLQFHGIFLVLLSSLP